MNRNATKWVIGVSSVALFTALLYAEGQLNIGSGAQANAEMKNASSDTGSNRQSSNNEDLYTGFINNEQDADSLQNMNSDEKGQRESWISSLDWGQKELTIVPRADQSTKHRSSLRTRRS
jgi:hypothetical protein